MSVLFTSRTTLLSKNAKTKTTTTKKCHHRQHHHRCMWPITLQRSDEDDDNANDRRNTRRNPWMVFTLLTDKDGNPAPTLEQILDMEWQDHKHLRVFGNTDAIHGVFSRCSIIPCLGFKRHWDHNPEYYGICRYA
jgi:hypothetical protein